MRAKLISGVLAAAVAVLLLPAAASAQCVMGDKPEEVFARSEAVFVGTVVNHRPTGAQGAHDIVDIATLRVQQSWKGSLARDVQIGADRPFEVGKRYVVFAAGTPLSTSILCGWTEPTDRAKGKLDWLSKRRGGTLSGTPGQAQSIDQQLNPRIPRPAPEKYAAVRDAKDWLNPYLQVCSDGVHLTPESVKSQSVVAPRDLREALVRLPVEAWPYGRIAALQECSLAVREDVDARRQRLAQVEGVLKALGVQISRWPS